MSQHELGTMTTAEIVQLYYDTTTARGGLRIASSMGMTRYRGERTVDVIHRLEQEIAAILDEAERRGVLESLIH